jgi:hypothetical protein
MQTVAKMGMLAQSKVKFSIDLGINAVPSFGYGRIEGIDSPGKESEQAGDLSPTAQKPKDAEYRSPSNPDLRV